MSCSSKTLHLKFSDPFDNTTSMSASIYFCICLPLQFCVWTKEKYRTRLIFSSAWTTRNGQDCSVHSARLSSLESIASSPVCLAHSTQVHLVWRTWHCQHGWEHLNSARLAPAHEVLLSCSSSLHSLALMAFCHSHSLIHWFSHSFTHSLIHSSIDSFLHLSID